MIKEYAALLVGEFIVATTIVACCAICSYCEYLEKDSAMRNGLEQEYVEGRVRPIWVSRKAEKSRETQPRRPD